MNRKGFYRHYKGHVYYVVGVACMKHAGDRRVVVYTSVRTENDEAHPQALPPGGRFDFLARDAEEFDEYVRLDARGEVAETMGGHKPAAYAAMHGFVRRFEPVTDAELFCVPQPRPTTGDDGTGR